MISKQVRKLAAPLAFAFLGLLTAGQPTRDLEVWALRLAADDLEKCARFYMEVLGFEAVEGSAENQRILQNGPARIVLHRTHKTPGSAARSRVSLNFRVADMSETARRAKLAGGALLSGEPETNQIGRHWTAADPAGNRINLMELIHAPLNSGDKPEVFNLSVRVRDMAEAERFYGDLGFQVLSRQYLPATLPLRQKGAIAIVVHPEETSQLGTPADPVILLKAGDPARFLARMAESRMLAVEGGWAMIEAPSGNRVAVWKAAGAP